MRWSPSRPPASTLEEALGTKPPRCFALGLATSDLGALSTDVLARFGLTHPQYNVLRMLAGAGDRGLTHTEITKWMVTGVPDVTRMVDKLEKGGLLRRTRDPADRRKVLHHIEPAGLQLLGEIQPEMAAVHDWIEEALSEPDRKALVALCEKVIQIVATRRGG